MNNIATLKGLKCPNCGCEQLKVTGTKGALGAALATGAAFGAIGNMVAGSNAKSNIATEPLQYKCTACKKKFSTLPLLAPMEDVLAFPCNVTFTRVNSFVGAVVPQMVYLNGVKLGAVKNGQTIHFPTSNRYNIIYVTDQYGVAFKSEFSFEAQPGGNVTARFKNKFLNSPGAPVLNMTAPAPAPIPAAKSVSVPPQPSAYVQAPAAQPQPSAYVQAPAAQPQPSAYTQAPAAQPQPSVYVQAPAAQPQPSAFVQAASIPSQPTAYVQAAANGLEPQVRFCTNCGASLKDFAMFCPECGAKRFSMQE